MFKLACLVLGGILDWKYLDRVPLTDIAEFIETAVHIKERVLYLHLLFLFLFSVHDNKFRLKRFRVFTFYSLIQHFYSQLRIDKLTFGAALFQQLMDLIFLF